MRLIKLIVVLCAAYGGYHYWQQQQTTKQLQAMTNTNGFVAMPAPDGQDANTVYVVAAENCSHEEAQRANRLFESLSRENISVQRTHNVSFSSLKDQGEADRINPVMKANCRLSS